jgi:hypothetical protein
LDACKTILNIDPEKTAHSRELDHHPAVYCQCPARQSCARSSRCERNFGASEYAKDVCDFLGRTGKDDGSRTVFVLRQSIALIDEQLVWLGQYRAASNYRAQVFR